MKQQMLSEIVAKLSGLGITVQNVDHTDVSILSEFLDAGWSTGSKKISYEAYVFIDEQCKTVFMYEKTTEVGHGLSFGTDSESSFQSGTTLFRKVKSVQYGPEGKAYECTLDLGAIPKSIKETSKNYGYKFKTVLSKNKAQYPSGYVSSTATPDTVSTAPGMGQTQGGYFMFCTQCGKEIANGAQFCPECGAQQGSGGSVNSQSQTPQNQMPQYRQTQPQQQPTQYQQPQYQQAPPPPPQYQQPQYQQAPPPQYQQQPQGAFVSAPRKKKRHGCLITIVVVFLIFGVLIVAAALNGGEIGFSTANVAEACMASQINETTFEPIIKTDVFAQTDTVIYVTAIVKNAPSKKKVSAIWYYINTGDSMRSENDIYTEDASTRIQFSLNNTNGFVPGDYKVEILLDDEVKETVNFKVK